MIPVIINSKAYNNLKSELFIKTFKKTLDLYRWLLKQFGVGNQIIFSVFKLLGWPLYYNQVIIGITKLCLNTKLLSILMKYDVREVRKLQIFEKHKILLRLKTYKACRFAIGLPANGQRSKTNRKTSKRLSTEFFKIHKTIDNEFFFNFCRGQVDCLLDVIQID